MAIERGRGSPPSLRSPSRGSRERERESEDRDGSSSVHDKHTLNTRYDSSLPPVHALPSGGGTAISTILNKLRPRMTTLISPHGCCYCCVIVFIDQLGYAQGGVGTNFNVEASVTRVRCPGLTRASLPLCVSAHVKMQKSYKLPESASRNSSSLTRRDAARASRGRVDIVPSGAWGTFLEE